MYFQSLNELIDLLSGLPGLGRRSAMRIAFYLLKSDPHRSHELAHAITELRQKVQFCQDCGGLSETPICSICDDPSRNQNSLCIVEEPGDIYAVENTGEFSGKYHVLMGALSPLDGIGPEDLRLQELKEKIQSGNLLEIIIATNPTMEGDATAHYIHDMLRAVPLNITRISHGVSTGGSIEFAERSALARSIRHRERL